MKLQKLAWLFGIPLIVVILVVFGSDKSFNSYPEQGNKKVTKITASEKMNVPAPTTKVDITKDYSAVLHTSMGDISISLTALDTPFTVTNFVYLSKLGFYDNLTFHRVIKGFMIQTGDPRGDGTGGPGYQFDDEPFDGDYTRGTVAMANAGPNTNGSQFFIMQQDNLQMPKNYVIFGHVTSGMDVVDKIADVKVVASPSGELSQPETPVLLNSVDIIEQ